MNYRVSGFSSIGLSPCRKPHFRRYFRLVLTQIILLLSRSSHFSFSFFFSFWDYIIPIFLHLLIFALLIVLLSRVSFCCVSCWKHLEMIGSVTNADPELVVGNPDSLANKIAAIRSASPQKLQVIADFDATLTKFWVNGTRGQSSHGLVQQDNPEYDAKRQELYDYYHPLEFSQISDLKKKLSLWKNGGVNFMLF